MTIPDETVGVRSYGFPMPRGNPAVKMAITVDAEVHAAVLRAAEAEGLSVSAWLTEAARKELRRLDGLAAIAEYEAEHGAFTDQELADARARNADVERRMEEIRRARAHGSPV